jgi:hypothetical protein
LHKYRLSFDRMVWMREKDVVKANHHVLWKTWGGGIWESSVRIACLWTEVWIQEFHKAVSSGPICLQDFEAVTFSRQGTCWCYKEFTDYHPILIIVVLQSGALYCLSSLTVLECNRWRSCFQWWEQEPFTSWTAYCRGGATVLEACFITGKARWGPQTERLVQISDQINMTDLNCKAEVNVGI